MKQVLLIVLVVVLTVGAMAAGAGIYKWAMVTPHPAPEPIPTPAPASTPEPTLNKSLIGDLLQGYVLDSNVSDTDVRCITCRPGGKRRPNWIGAGGLDLRYIDDKWTLYHAGPRCKGLETWEIDDATGAITYLGSSTPP